jgi:levanase/fructan beta-fructosidase
MKTTTGLDSQYRPKWHYSAERNWLNDPNGLLYSNGTYHLFYQHNPFGDDWGNMSWGHATSTDLRQWEEQPVAIPCTEQEGIFSGSAVLDFHNTSGFGVGGVPPLVAIYTSAYCGDSPFAARTTVPPGPSTPATLCLTGHQRTSAIPRSFGSTATPAATG